MIPEPVLVTPCPSHLLGSFLLVAIRSRLTADCLAKLNSFGVCLFVFWYGEKPSRCPSPILLSFMFEPPAPGCYPCRERPHCRPQSIQPPQCKPGPAQVSGRNPSSTVGATTMRLGFVLWPSWHVLPSPIHKTAIITPATIQHTPSSEKEDQQDACSVSCVMCECFVNDQKKKNHKIT